MNAKASTPEEANAKIATIQQIIMAINAVSKVTFFSNLSFVSNIFFPPLHFFHSLVIVIFPLLKRNVILVLLVFCDISVTEQLFHPMRYIFSHLILTFFFAIRNSDMYNFIFIFQGFNERLVTTSRPAIGLMFKQVNCHDPFCYYFNFSCGWWIFKIGIK